MSHPYSLSVISLLKGIVYSHQKEVWNNLVEYEPDVRKYFLPLALELYLDKSEGFAYLRQAAPEEAEALPKLAQKRQLDFTTSLICLLLRKYLLEQDAQGGSLRTIISEAEIISRAKVFLPISPDEAKQQDKLGAAINKVVEFGFLRKLEDNSNGYEVHRVIKGFVDADVIDSTLKRLHAYAAEKNVL